LYFGLPEYATSALKHAGILYIQCDFVVFYVFVVFCSYVYTGDFKSPTLAVSFTSRFDYTNRKHET